MIFRPSFLLDKHKSDKGIFEYQSFYPLLMLSFACILYGLSVGINISSFSIFLNNSGMSSDKITLILSKELIGNIAISPFVIILTSYFGVFILMIISLFVRNIALVLFGMGESYDVWSYGMILFGCGGFILYVLIFQWVNYLARNEFRATYLSIASFAFGLGIALGPIMILYFDIIPGKLTFIISIILSSMMIFPIIVISKFAPPNLKQAQIKISKIINFAYIPMICVVTSEYLFYSLSEFMPLYILGNGFDYNYAYLVSAYYYASGLILSIPVGILIDRYNRISAILLFALAILVAIQLVPMFLNNYIVLILVFIILSTSVNGVIIAGLSILGDKFFAEDFISANSTVHALSTLGGYAGITITGNAMTNIGDKGFIFSISSISLVFLAMIVIEAYKEKRKWKNI